MQAGYTAPDAIYPGYVNFTREADGSVRVTVRAAPTERDGIFICAHRRDAGPGRCTPGGPSCNNYCNLHPDRSKPMPDSPLDCTHTDCGDLAAFTVPADAWEQLLSQFAEH